MKYLLYTFLTATVLLVSCTNQPPKVFTTENKIPRIYPDYNGVTIPCNIAPLNFVIEESANQYLTKISSPNGNIILSQGRKVQINPKDWEKLLANNKGKSYSIDIYLKKETGWVKYNTITNYIAPYAIDEYISYRLIEPGYMTYELITINQRNLTNFDEREIYNNLKTSSGENKSQCINCHSYQNYRTGNMQIHFRQYKGGTVIINEGEATKIDTKTKNALSACVYPSWHPTQKLIAYSVNTTGQVFHTNHSEKIEVVDSESDLVLYDVTKNEIRYIVKDPGSLETWPGWSPDGKTLYFASAHFNPQGKNPTKAVVDNYQNIKYDLLRIPFNPQTLEFGQPDTVFRASKIGKSAAVPRISPDGRYLLFTLADYGNFHIWHKSSDLYLIDLHTGKVRNMEEINSPDVDSYHAWSSNGRWIIFSTRREDGSYTRSYIAYFDKYGKARKPFVLPQKNPDLYANLLKSFNVPEFMVEPVKLSVTDFYKIVSQEATQATYK